MVRYHSTAYYMPEYGESITYLTAIPVRLTQVRYQVDWVPLLNVYESPGGVSPVVRTDGSNQTRLSRPSAVSPLLAEPFEIFMAAAMASFLCRAFLLPLCSRRSRDQFAIVAACCLSVQFSAFFPLPRTNRSFKLFMLLFDFILYRQRSSRACVVVTPLAFSISSLTRCLSCCFACYRCICSYLIHSFGPLPFSYTLLSHPITPLHLLGSVSLLGSHHLWITFRMSYLDVRWILRFGVEALTC